MAYKTEELFETAKKVIKKHNLFFIEDVVAYLPCTKSTFYLHFPVDSDNYKEIIEELERNRNKKKIELRDRWSKLDTPALQLSLYKLLSTPDELRKLSMQTVEQNTELKLVWNEEKTYNTNEAID